jgi:hypothetical protein
VHGPGAGLGTSPRLIRRLASARGAAAAASDSTRSLASSFWIWTSGANIDTSTCLHLEIFDVERLAVVSLDVKQFDVKEW